jgi:hypothetical protein
VLREAGILSELFFIEKQSIRNLVDVMSELNDRTSSPYVDFYRRLFEIAIYFEGEFSRP